MKAVLPAYTRPFLAPHLPAGVDVAYARSPEDVVAGVADAEIGWLDTPGVPMTEFIARGRALKWVSTAYAGVDRFPLQEFARRNILFTHGAGINAIPVAEYAVMGVVAAAKRIDEIVRAHDRKDWLDEAPGKTEIFETKALIIGMGAIGREIASRLRGLGVEVTGVRRRPDAGAIGPDAWRDRLGEFDWIILAAPITPETKHCIAAAELAAMKQTAWIIAVSRGGLIDHDALYAAVSSGRIGGAFLDVADPEPLPQTSPLWSAKNVIITMHLSGRSTRRFAERASALFLDNLRAYCEGRPMRNIVDLAAGY
ncbi:MAG: D-2-hydroxyacid dehydrogenase [Hyphomonadaceae bacterium]|nr:D-2-hydroxyacid dehydrogenase [Hyphomonadaceae bacterium]